MHDEQLGSTPERERACCSLHLICILVVSPLVLGYNCSLLHEFNHFFFVRNLILKKNRLFVERLKQLSSSGVPFFLLSFFLLCPSLSTSNRNSESTQSLKCLRFFGFSFDGVPLKQLSSTARPNLEPLNC